MCSELRAVDEWLNTGVLPTGLQIVRDAERPAWSYSHTTAVHSSVEGSYRGSTACVLPNAVFWLSKKLHKFTDLNLNLTMSWSCSVIMNCAHSIYQFSRTRLRSDYAHNSVVAIDLLAPRAEFQWIEEYEQVSSTSHKCKWIMLMHVELSCITSAICKKKNTEHRAHHIVLIFLKIHGAGLDYTSLTRPLLVTMSTELL